MQAFLSFAFSFYTMLRRVYTKAIKFFIFILLLLNHCIISLPLGVIFWLKIANRSENKFVNVYRILWNFLIDRFDLVLRLPNYVMTLYFLSLINFRFEIVLTSYCAVWYSSIDQSQKKKELVKLDIFGWIYLMCFVARHRFKSCVCTEKSRN